VATLPTTAAAKEGNRRTRPISGGSRASAGRTSARVEATNATDTIAAKAKSQAVKLPTTST